jgi:hypothetical protein
MNLRRIIRRTLMESYNTTVQYCAVVIKNPDDTRKIKELASQYVPSEGWSEPPHYHMTIGQGPLPDSLKRRGDLNKEVEITINMIGVSDKAIALGTFGYYSRNEMPHITVAFNTANGGAPADSKEIDNWKPIDKITVTGIIREIGEGNVVLDEIVDNAAGEIRTSVRAYPGIPAEFPQEDDYDQFGNIKGSLDI